MTASVPSIASSELTVNFALGVRYGSNPATLDRVLSEARKLFEYIHTCGIGTWDEITPELVLAWSWAARLDRSGRPRSPALSTARNRQWAAIAVFQIAEHHGWVANGRILAGGTHCQPAGR